MAQAPEVQLAQALNVLRYEVFRATYRDDPVGFVLDCIDFPAGESLTPYQREFLEAVATHDDVADRGPHGLGKTAIKALLIHWFALTRDGIEGEDWKIPTTASVGRQLFKFLWPEVHKWGRRIRWDRVGRGPYIPNVELKKNELELSTGVAFAAVSNDPANLEGVHATHVLFIYDEAKSIPDEVFDATEGAVSTGNEGGRTAKRVASSTPGSPNGRFHAIHTHRPGYENWKTMHVTKDEVIAAGRMSEAWAEGRRRAWGEDSALYQNRVLGEFAAEQDATIPLSWVEAAIERGKDWLESHGIDPEDHSTEEAWALAADHVHKEFMLTGVQRAMGVDVADTGSDRNVIAPRLGRLYLPLLALGGQDTMVTTGNIVSRQETVQGWQIVDVIGVGSGVVARLRELGQPVLAFHAGERTNFRDRTGELRFANKRAAAWWNMREILSPQWNSDLILPDDEELISDLTAPKYRPQSGGAIVIEPKDGEGREWGLRKRLGRSTDRGDAVVMAAYCELLRTIDAPEVQQLVEYYEPVAISPY